MRAASVKIIISSFLLLLMNGCTTISKEQCELGDWYQIGLYDGQNGNENLAADYKKDCAEYKVNVDVNKYNDGRNEGLKSYCTYENGVIIGQQGKSYNNVCPSTQSANFLSGYRPYYNVASTENKLRDKRIEASALEQTIKDKETDKNTRSDAKSTLNVTKDDIKQLKNDLNTYEYELAIHKINREIELTERQLTNANEQQQIKLKKRLEKLHENKSMIEDLQLTEEGIKTIKAVIELFK